ncbi:MAG: hypothetical protein U9N09_01010 [Euryarchaeota archaeon]|nr:hypothetical protein [Euryarchaeota archaeon]
MITKSRVELDSCTSCCLFMLWCARSRRAGRQERLASWRGGCAAGGCVEVMRSGGDRGVCRRRAAVGTRVRRPIRPIRYL